MADWVINEITFSGDTISIEKLIGKLKELEYKDSIQIMGDLLGFNSYESQELNTINYGVDLDFRLIDCKLYLNDDKVLISGVQTKWGPPTIFLSKVCKKYKIKGRIDMDGFPSADDLTILSDCYGNITYEEISYKPEDWYLRDSLEFISVELYNLEKYENKEWGELKEKYSFVSNNDLLKLEEKFNELKWCGLF